MHLFIIETSKVKLISYYFLFFFFLVNSGIGHLVYKWKFGINVSFSSSKIEVKKKRALSVEYMLHTVKNVFKN